MGPKSVESDDVPSDIEIIEETKVEKSIDDSKSDNKSFGEINARGRGGNTARGTGRSGGKFGMGRGSGQIPYGSENNPNLIQVAVGQGNNRRVFERLGPQSTNGPLLGPTRGFGGGPAMFNDRLAKYQEYLDSNIRSKLAVFKGQSMKNLSELDRTEKKFNGRAQLYVGGISSSVTEKQLKEWFAEFGEVGEIYYKKEKLFAFVRMDTRLGAEKAKVALDGQTKNGKVLKVKYSVHQAAIKVSNLGPWVSNELLNQAFSVFGEIERCLVFSDEKGVTKEKGIVEFAKKGVAMEAVRRCSEGCFLICTSLRPVYAELITHAEDDDGVPEKSLPKYSNEYNLERETGPRFATLGTFEYEYGTKWKGLYELKKQKEEALKVEMRLEEAKLVAQMEYNRFEHETDMLREELRKKEAVRDQQKSMWSIKEKYMEDIMKQEHEKQRSLEEGIFNRIQDKTNKPQEKSQGDNFTSKQELEPDSKDEEEIADEPQGNPLFSQAQQLSSILDLQNSLMGMDQNTNDALDEGTLETLSALLNLQQSSFAGNFGNQKRKGNKFDNYVDAEDLHLEGEFGNQVGKRQRSK